MRNYEAAGVLPAAGRTASGYRVYTERHAGALAAFLALVPAFGYPAARTIMWAVDRGDLDAAFQAIDAGHAQLIRDRQTLDAVESAVGQLLGDPPTHRPDPDQPGPSRTSPDHPHRRSPVRTGARQPASGRINPGAAGTGRADTPLPVGAVAHRLGITAAALLKWERAGILTPQRDRAGYRVYRAADVRDAELAHLLRRGGYPLAHIATVVRQVNEAGGAEPLAASLAGWRRRLTARGRAMLTAAARLDEYLTAEPPAATTGDS